ncbi:hypothetical protein L1887_16650 [Cichorium endivia]|nr:hypothetical protein L1887_16650 [Cichorium endivia]
MFNTYISILDFNTLVSSVRFSTNIDSPPSTFTLPVLQNRLGFGVISIDPSSTCHHKGAILTGLSFVMFVIKLVHTSVPFHVPLAEPCCPLNILLPNSFSTLQIRRLFLPLSQNFR